MADHDELTASQAENAGLIELLEASHVEWRSQATQVMPSSAAEPSILSPNEKVALFRRLFRCRIDVYPVRWESKTTGKAGYSQAN